MEKKLPELQLALDYVSLPSAIAMAALVKDYVDIIEVGTPLVKAAGMAAVSAIKEVCPNNRVLADVKTPDVGALEAQMSFDAGADIMTVIQGAPLETVKDALETAKKNNKEMLIELTGVRDLSVMAPKWRELGVEWLVYHREWDAQAHGLDWGEEHFKEIRELIDMGFKLTITGGLTPELIPLFKGISAGRVIAGRAIHASEDPIAAAKAIRKAIEETWS